MSDTERKLKNLEAYNGFMLHITSLPQPEQLRIFHIASKLWDVLVLPGALNAFALVGAELAVRHDNDELMVPEIIRP